MKRAISTCVGIVVGVLATFSIISLIQQNYELAFQPVLETLLSRYDGLLSAVISRVEPYIQHEVKNLCQVAEAKCQLLPHWKHVLVLIWIYFGNSARVYWKESPALSAFAFVWGGLVALIAAIAAGSLPQNHDPDSMLIPVVVLAAYLLYRIGVVMWRSSPDKDELSRLLRLDGTIAIGGTAVLLLGMMFPRALNVPQPGLAIVGVFVLILALTNLLRGAYHVTGRHPLLGAKWWLSLSENGNAKLGSAMLFVFTLAILAVLSSAT